MTYLGHYHREGENIRPLAKCPLAQELWRSPSRSVTTLARGAPRGIQVLGDHSEAKIRDTCATRVVHNNVCLSECQ